MSSPELGADRSAARRHKAAFVLQTWGVYLGLLALLAVSAAVSPRSFNAQDLLNLAKQSSSLGIVSIGQTLVILTGGIDLSVGSTITLVHVVSVGTILGRPEMVLPVALLCVLLGAAIGAVNGLGITQARISPFVMTLCTDFILRGVYMIYTKGQPIGVVPENLRFIGRGRILEVVPVAALIWIGLALLFVFLLRRTVFGARLYAVGANPRAAWLSGVKNPRIIFTAYTLTGVLAAVAALILTGDMGAVSLGLGGDYAMDSIAATVIGGTMFAGGIGGVEGTVAGSFIIRLLTSLLQKANVSNPGKLIIQGALILAIVGAYSRRKKE
jgi:ribose/xylose/arabinose/galactoside ABC-type transport system permease subunit